jgi:hypothetical protein
MQQYVIIGGRWYTVYQKKRRRIVKAKCCKRCLHETYYSWFLSTVFFQWSVILIQFIGSWFQCGIVYGKNECLYVSLEVCICLYVRGWYFLVLVSETINMSDGTATRWNDTLYITSNQQIKTQAYQVLVRPKLEYSCSIWDPRTSESIRKIEMVQRRAARYLCNWYHNTKCIRYAQ